MKRHFQMLAAYNAWANHILFDAAEDLSPDEWTRQTGSFFGSMMGTLNHVLVADRIWMKRFTGEGDAPARLDAIIQPDFALLRNERYREDSRIAGFVDSLTDEQVEGRFTYVTATDMRTISMSRPPTCEPYPSAWVRRFRMSSTTRHTIVVRRT